MSMASNGKPIVVNGVGTAYLNVVTNGVAKSIPLGTLQDMQLQFSGSVEKVRGSDALQPIYIFDKDSDIKVSFTEARFNLEWLAFSNGAVMSNNGQLIFQVEPTLIASGTAFTVPGAKTAIVPSSCVVMLSDDANGTQNVTSLAYVAAAPTAGQFTITAAGVITLGTSVTAKYISVNGIETDTVSRTATVTTASVPGFVTIRHTSKPVNMGDGVNVILHTQIFKAKATGAMSIDQGRQKAMTPKLEMEVFYDTMRTDGAVLTISQQLA